MRGGRRTSNPFSFLFAALTAAGCAGTLKPGDPVRGLTQVQRDSFAQGKTLFSRVFAPETGLGPLFNAVGCGECHEEPVAGGFGDEVEQHATAFRADQVCDPLVEQGGFVIQAHVTPALKAALGIDSEPVPADATATARRTTPVIFGRGFLDLVPDAEILSRADPDDRNHDGISGRPNRFVDGRIGRFGRKALVPTLREFNEGAYAAEQGITTPGVPTEETIGGKPIPDGVDPVPEPEIDRGAVDLTNAFVRFLAVPSPLKLSGEAGRGRDQFERIGCTACHIPTLRTGASPIAALNHKEVAAFTDLLLHDMGPELADICLGLAQPSEFRTEPLIGVRLRKDFLHDGRATTLPQAIQLHGGEAATSRDRFLKLKPAEQAAVIAYLKTL